MGVFSFVHEFKSKVSRKRMFKALITESHDVLPKAVPAFKSIEIVRGDGGVGTIKKINFPDGAHIKYIKNRIDVLDQENYVCKYTLIEGDVLDDKIESACYEMKFEDAHDGGCVIKITSEYHTKGGVELKEEDVKAGKEQAIGLYKTCEGYLIANPEICV